MGDPTDPGEDQETTIVVEGPPEGATQDEIDSFNRDFEAYKRELSETLHRWHATKLKARLRKIVYVKKQREEEPR
jgi:hypothetical protein